MSACSIFSMLAPEYFLGFLFSGPGMHLPGQGAVIITVSFLVLPASGNACNIVNCTTLLKYSSDNFSSGLLSSFAPLSILVFFFL
jgi:hypothetical protein